MTPPVPANNERRLHRAQRRDSRGRHAQHVRSSIARSQRLNPVVPFGQSVRGDRSVVNQKTRRDAGDDPRESDEDENDENTERDGSASKDDQDAARQATHTNRTHRRTRRRGTQTHSRARSLRERRLTPSKTSVDDRGSERTVTVPEQQLVQLQNTLIAVARAANISIGAPCTRCERSYLMASDGLLFCPHCKYRRSL